MRRVASLLAAFGAALMLTTGMAAAQTTTLTPEARVQAIVEPSVVYLESHWTAYVKLPISGIENTSLGPFEFASRCTGFIVSPQGHIVTAGHCVDNTTTGARRDVIRAALKYVVDTYQPFWSEDTLQRVYINSLDSAEVTGQAAGSAFEPDVYAQRGVATSGLKTSEVYRARVIDFEPLSRGDVAVLKIEATNLPSLELSPSADVQVGTQVLSVGYPGSSDLVADESLTPTFKDGKINSLKTREEGSLPVYEMSAALSGGMSGGPTVDMDGRVVGINSFKIEGETEAFNWLSPSSLISEMLGGNGISAQLGPLDREYREGLSLLVAGDGKAAVPHFEAVLALSPSHQQAQGLLQRAKAVAATQKSFPVALVAAIAGVLIALVGGALLFRKRRARAQHPAPQHGVDAYAATVQAPAEPHADVTQPAPVASAGEAAEAPVPTATAVAVAPEPAVTALHELDAPNGAAKSPSTAKTAAATAARFCASCGTELAGNARFCPGCGHQV